MLILSWLFKILGSKYGGLNSLFHIGGRKYLCPFAFIYGEKGVVVFIPKDFIFESIQMYTKSPKLIPKKPAIKPKQNKNKSKNP